MEKNSIHYNKSENNIEDAIDLKNLFSFIVRNKLLIGTVAFFSFVIACLYSLTLKRVWEGQFQIVLNSKNDSIVSAINPALSNFIKSDRSNDLRTQVGVLESPSVIMPIYDFVNQNGNTKFKNELSFPKWKKNLDITLKKDTSILNIAYRDSNKEIILPALKKLSLIYQDFSGEAERRNQDLTNKYLISQIELFKKKSSNSIRTAQNFAIDQNLIYLGNNNLNYSELDRIENNQEDLVGTLGGSKTNVFGSILNIENIRVASANKIRKIDLQLKKINELDPSDYENLQYFGSSIPALAKEGLPDTLKKIEERLVVLRTKFTEKDRSIIRLLKERQLTVDLLKSRAIKYLKVAKLEAEATMEAAMRPKGVLLEYKEILREAARDESTLINLENNLRVLKLQQAKESDPWKLITKPTLLKSPVAPSRRNIGMVGLILGSFLGLFIAFYKEKKSDKIFELRNLELILSTKFVDKVTFEKGKILSSNLLFLIEFINKQIGKKVYLITLNKNEYDLVNNFKKCLIKQYSFEKDIEISVSISNIKDLDRNDIVILCSSANSNTYNAIEDLGRKLSILELKLNGYILLENT